MKTQGWSKESYLEDKELAGYNHPIAVASRRLAITSIRKYAMPQPAILEVGCSSGHLLRDLQREFPTSELAGIDIVPQAIENLQLILPNVHLLAKDITDTPKGSEHYDVIIALNVLEHIQKDGAALEGMWRLLKHRGVLHIEVPQGPRLFDAYDEHYGHYRRYTRQTLEFGCVDCSGFHLIKATHLGFFAYPAFSATKIWNRRLAKLSTEEKGRIIQRQVVHSRRSFLLSMLMRLESLVGLVLPFPTGIRCVMVLRKP